MPTKQSLVLFSSSLKYHSRTVLKPGEWPRAPPFALWPFPGALMTYPDERSESLEGQMQSYTVSGRRSLHETDV